MAITSTIDRFAPRALLRRPSKISVELTPAELATLIEGLEAKALRAADDPELIDAADCMFIRIAERGVRTVSSFNIEDLRPVTKPGVLRGWFTLLQPSGQRIHDCSVYHRDSWWVSPPSKPRLGRDGLQLKDASGRPQWSPVVSFASRELSDRWSDAVLTARREQHPELFDELALTAGGRA